MQMFCEKCNIQHDDGLACMAEHFLPEKPKTAEEIQQDFDQHMMKCKPLHGRVAQMHAAIDNRIRIWEKDQWPDGPGQQSKFLHRLEFLMRDLENYVGFQAQGAADVHTQRQRQDEK